VAIGHSVVNKDLIREFFGIPHSAREQLWRRTCTEQWSAGGHVSHAYSKSHWNSSAERSTVEQSEWIKRWMIAEMKSTLTRVPCGSITATPPPRKFFHQPAKASSTRIQHGAIQLSSCRPDVDSKNTTRDFYKSIYDRCLRKTNKTKTF